MEILPINAKRNYQSIIEQFVHLLGEGQIKVGDQLPPERTLAEMFNVSRASIREAFAAMEIIGLIEVRPGEGAFVTDLNIAPFLNTIAPLFLRNGDMEHDLLDFRRMLELEAVGQAALKATPERLCLLETALGSMKAAIASGDTNAGAEADIAFHKAVFTMTGNFILAKAAECIGSLLEFSVRFNRQQILRQSEGGFELYRQHMGIHEAIAAGQPELARDLMERHLYYVLKIS